MATNLRIGGFGPDNLQFGTAFTSFMYFFFFVIVDLAHFSDLFARCFLIEIKQQSSRAQQPLLTQLWEYSIAARAAVFTNQGRQPTLVEPPPNRPNPPQHSNTTGAAQCAGTVSAHAQMC